VSPHRSGILNRIQFGYSLLPTKPLMLKLKINQYNQIVKYNHLMPDLSPRDKNYAQTIDGLGTPCANM
jgi:hypothetical protein